MAVLRYISHPNVHIDPDTPVPQWHLSDIGRQRAHKMLDQPWIGTLTAIISSDETKALETAQVIVGATGLEIDVRSNTAEIDRSSTGYVTHDRHEELANQLFAAPDESAEGWETATDAQARVVGALTDVLTDRASQAEVAVVGHGGVGTLLYCWLAGLAIGRQHDQPGGGHHWAYDLAGGRSLHGWRPIDEARD